MSTAAALAAYPPLNRDGNSTHRRRAIGDIDTAGRIALPAVHRVGDTAP